MDMNLGLGVMISRLGEGNTSAKAVRQAQGKLIHAISMHDNVEDPYHYHDELRLELDIGVLVFYDDGQSCCEHRYMHTDDDLQSFVGASFISAEIREVGEKEDKDNWIVHEIDFLLIHTTLGTFTVETHNEHNGYYGGFSVVARLREKSGE